MGTTDARRDVNIAINVVGNVATKFTEIANGLTALQTQLTGINSVLGGVTSGIDKLSSSFTGMVVPDINGFTKEVKKLSQVDSAQITAFVESAKGLKGLGVSNTFSTMVKGLQDLSGVSSLPDLKVFAASVDALKKSMAGMPIANITKLGEALQTFSGVAIPTGTKLTNFATAVTALNKADTTKIDAGKLVKISAALGAFSGVGSLPSGKTFTDFASALKTLSTFTITAAKVTNLKALAEVLPSYQGLATGLPTKKKFTDFAAGLKVFTAIDFSKIDTTKMIGVSTAIRTFMGIKGSLPDLGKFSTQVSELGKINTAGITKIVPQINLLVSALQSLATVTPALKVFISLSSAMGSAGSALQNVGKGLSEVGSKAATAGKGLKQTSDAMQDASVKSSKFGASLKKLGGNISNYVRYRLIADSIIALKEAVFGGISAIIDYDQSLKDLQAITGATGLEVEQMGDKIIQVAADTKFSASEVATGMRTLGQAGFSAGESVQAMSAIANLATGTLSDMSATVDLVSTALRVFRLDASETARVADVFANAVNRSKLTTDKLRISMNYVGPIARDVGLSIEEMSAAMMTLANSGLRASTIGTGLRRVLAELASPTDKLAAAAAKAGVALDDLSPESNKFTDVIRNLGLVVGDTGTAFDLFGKRGAAAVLALSSQGNSFDTMLASASRSGTAAEMAGIQMEGLGVALKNLQDKFGVLAISMGSGGFTGILKGIVNISRSVVDAFISMSDNGLAKVVTQLGLATTGLLLFAATIKSVTSTSFGLFLISIVKNLKLITTGFYEAATAAGVFNTVSGIAIVVGAVAALAAVLYGLPALYNYATNSAREASNEASKLADQYEQNAKTIENYKVAVASLNSGSDEQNVENAKLRVSLMQVVEEGKELAPFAYEAATAINALNGEMSDTGALDKYYEKALELEKVNIAKSFNEGFNSLKQHTGLVENIMDTFKGLIPAAGAFAGEFANAITDWNWYREPVTQLAEAVLDGIKGGLGALNDNRISVRIAEDLNAGKMSWKDFTEYATELMGKLESDLTPKEKTLLKVFKDTTEDTQKALEKMGLAGAGAANITTTQMLIAADTLGLLAGKGTAARDSLITSFNQVKDNLKFTDIIGKWDEDNQKIPAGVDQIAEAYKKVGTSVDELDKLVAEGLMAKQQAYIEEKKLLEANKLAAIEDGGDKLEITRDYLEKSEALKKKASALQIQLNANEIVQSVLKERSLAAIRDKALAENEARNKTGQESNIVALEEFAKTEAAILAEYQKGIAAIRGETTNAAQVLAASTLTSSETEKQLKKSLYNIAALEAGGVITHEKAEKDKLKASVSYYSTMSANAAKAYAEIQQMAANGDNVDADDLKDANEASIKSAEDLAKAKLALLVAYGKDVDKINKDIAKEQKKADTEAIKNAKTLAKAKAKASEGEEKARTKQAKAIAKAEVKYDAVVAKSKEDLYKKLEKLSQDYADARITRDATVADNNRSLADSINDVHRRSMSDEEKADNDRSQANKKYAEAVRLIGEANAASNEADRAAGIEKLKLADQLLGQSEALAANDADDSYAISKLKKITDAKNKAANAQMVLDRKIIQALAAEARAEQVKAEKEAKRVQDEAIKAAGELLVAELKTVSDKLEASKKAEGIRHDLVMKNIGLEVAQFKKLLAEAVALQSGAKAAIDQPAGKTTDSAESASGGSSNATAGVADDAARATAEVKKLGEALNMVKREAETDAEFSLRINNAKEVNDAITRINTESGKVGTNVERSSDVAVVGFNKMEVAAGKVSSVIVDPEAWKASVKINVDDASKVKAIQDVASVPESAKDKKIAYAVELETRVAIKQVDTLRNELKEIGTVEGNTRIFEPEDLERVKQIGIEMSKVFEGADPAEPVQHLKNMATVLENVEGISSYTWNSMYEQMREYADKTEGVTLEYDMSTNAFTLLDDMGNKIENLDKKITENPMEIFSPEQARTVMENLGKIPGAIDLIQDKAKEKVAIAVDNDDALAKAKEVEDALKRPEGEEAEGINVPVAADVEPFKTEMETLEEEIPEELQIKVETEGIDEAKGQIQSLSTEAEPYVIVFKGKASPEAGLGETITGIKTQLASLSDEVPPVILTIDQGEINDIIVELGKGNISSVTFELEGKEQVMDFLDVLEASKEMSVSISAEATPATKTDISQLQKFLDGFLPKSVTMTVLTDVAISAVGKLESAIAKIKDKTVTITTKYVEKRAGGGYIEGYAEGGSVFSKVAEPFVQAYAAGGNVFNRLGSPFIQKGGGREDDVPAMLMKGEFVMKQSAVQKYGTDLMYALNRGLLDLDGMRPKAYATGGMVSNAAVTAKSAVRGAQLAMNPSAPFKDSGVTYNISSPSFHQHVDDRASKFTSPRGRTNATNLLKSFSNIVPRMMSGGNADLLRNFRDEKRLTAQLYEEDIRFARESGDDQVAWALELEKLELEELANSLLITLEQIRFDFELEMLEAQEELEDSVADFQDDKDDAKDDYEDSLADLIDERRSMERTYLTEKNELDSELKKVNTSLATNIDSRARLRAALGGGYTGTFGNSQIQAQQLEVQGLENDLTRLEQEYREDVGSLESKEVREESKYKRETSQADASIATTNSRFVRNAELTEDRAIQEEAGETATTDIQSRKIKAETQFNINAIGTETDHTISRLQLELQLELLKLRKEYEEAVRAEEESSTTSSSTTSTAQALGVKYWLNKGGPVGYPTGKKRHEDDVLAMLTAGEYVVNEDAVLHYGADFMDALNKREVDPNYNAFPSFLSDTNPDLVNKPTTIDGVTYHINAPSFHDNLAARTHNIISGEGQKSAANLVGIFKDAVPQLAEGGAVAEQDKLLAAESALISTDYAGKIQYALDSGQEDLAYILSNEEIELEMIAEELRYTLAELWNEREWALKEALFEYELEVEMARQDLEEQLFDLQMDRLDAKADLEDAKADATADLADAKFEYDSDMADYKAALADYTRDSNNNSAIANATNSVEYDRVQEWANQRFTETLYDNQGNFKGYKKPNIGNGGVIDWDALTKYANAGSIGNHTWGQGTASAFISDISDMKSEQIENMTKDADRQASLTTPSVPSSSSYTAAVRASALAKANAESRYNSLMGMYDEKGVQYTANNANTNQHLANVYQGTNEKTEREYETSYQKADRKATLETRETMNTAEHDYNTREMDMVEDIRQLEAELAKQLFDLRKEYSTIDDFAGVKHWLNTGGPVGYPAGAARGVDSIKAMLTPGEYVIKEDVVKKLGAGFFDNLNKLKMPRMGFADGGLVPGGNSIPDSIGSQIENYLGKIDLGVNGKTIPVRTDMLSAKMLVKELKRMGLSTI